MYASEHPLDFMKRFVPSLIRHGELLRKSLLIYMLLVIGMITAMIHELWLTEGG